MAHGLSLKLAKLKVHPRMICEGKTRRVINGVVMLFGGGRQYRNQAKDMRLARQFAKASRDGDNGLEHQILTRQGVPRHKDGNRLGLRRRRALVARNAQA